jgi:hypothetical protein
MYICICIDSPQVQPRHVYICICIDMFACIYIYMCIYIVDKDDTHTYIRMYIYIGHRHGWFF